VTLKMQLWEICGLDCTVGRGYCKVVSCSNSNVKNITDPDMTGDM
jgi:hypothetical protein